MSEMPLISVIIPIYNVEKYLSECIDSIISQTYPNLEIVLVDDETPDRSGKIADEYAKKDGRIKVIHKPKNEGLNMARATGFKASVGDYVTFVDSDDMLTKYSLDLAVRMIIKHKTDFVRFREERFNDRQTLQGAMSARPSNKIELLKNKTDLYRKRFSGGNNVCVWGAVYPRKLVEKIDWKKSNYRVNEDLFWTQQFLSLCSSGAYLEYKGYMYRVNHRPSVLSKQITKNYLNEKPVGYLEFVGAVIRDAAYYNEKYNLNLDDVIDSYKRWLYRTRIERLAEVDGWRLENNIEYLSDAMPYFLEHYYGLQKDNEAKQEYIHQLEQEINRLNQEATQYFSIKRSGRLFLGNIKRRIRIRARLKDYLKWDRRSQDKELRLKFYEMLADVKTIDQSNKPKYIISLTTYGKRLDTYAPIAIASLMSQTRLPDKIILWLGYGEKIPKKLRLLQKRGLDIQFTDDIGAYTKFIPTLEKYPKANIVTADDDIIYPADWYEKIYKTHKEHPRDIICHRAHEVVVADEKIASYNEWKFRVHSAENPENIFPTGVGGVLYPPGSLHEDVLNRDVFLRLSPRNDDIWFWAMAKMQDSKFSLVESGYSDMSVLAIDPADKDGLWVSFNKGGGNDQSLKALVEYYPHILQKLK